MTVNRNSGNYSNTTPPHYQVSQKLHRIVSTSFVYWYKTEVLNLDSSNEKSEWDKMFNMWWKNVYKGITPTEKEQPMSAEEWLKCHPVKLIYNEDIQESTIRLIDVAPLLEQYKLIK